LKLSSAVKKAPGTVAADRWRASLFWLRTVLLSATFLGLLSCWPLWLNSREFPVIPITAWFPVLPSPWDQLFFGAMLLPLALAAWRYRVAVGFFLAATFVAWCEDQNRGQPWLYMYWGMLLLTLLPDSIALAACRLAMSAAYVWSGIQKVNPAFLNGSPAWFVAPAERWHLPHIVLDIFRWGIATAPFVEIAIGICLWVPRLRKAGIVAVFGVHLAALLFLGPLGHNYNWVVWPWNLAMIALVWVLFALGPAPRIELAFTQLKMSRPALALLTPYTLLPVLSFFGLWDSYFSFTLYSANEADANIFVTPGFTARLPARLQKYVHPVPQYHPQYQGPSMFLFRAWCYEDLHVLFVPEPRNYVGVFQHLRKYSREPGDLRLIVGPRGGSPVFYEDERRVVLMPKGH
jgi:hypothetical protein